MTGILTHLKPNMREWGLSKSTGIRVQDKKNTFYKLIVGLVFINYYIFLSKTVLIYFSYFIFLILFYYYYYFYFFVCVKWLYTKSQLLELVF